MKDPTVAEARSLEDCIDAIAHLAREGRAGARCAGGLRPETALEAIALLATSSLTEAAALRIGTQVESLPAEGINLEAHLEAVREKLMQEALDRCDGVQTKAAELLRMSFRSFRYYCKKYGLFRETDGEGVEDRAGRGEGRRAPRRPGLKATAVDELKRPGLL